MFERAINENHKMFSVLLAWKEDNHEAGTYAWSGMATDLDHAVKRARMESATTVNTKGPDPEEIGEDGVPTYAASKVVLDHEEGVNYWAASELNAAIVKAEAFISGFESDELQEGVNELLVEIRQAIAAATGVSA